VVDNLRITEIMYNPQDLNAEYIELKNIGVDPIDIGLVRFTDGIDFTFPSQELAAGEYILVAQDPTTLATVAPSIPPAVVILGPYTGLLDNGGEDIELVDAVGRTIHEFEYRDGWYDITDGGGFSLTLRDPENPDPSSWSQKKSWCASTYRGGSPGEPDNGLLPDHAVVINEALAHSDVEVYDWIELYNDTDQDINIGGWYLSDNDADDPNLKKYRIADGAVIYSHSYLVFTENEHFNNPGGDPGCLIPFALSEDGEEICISSAVGGELTGFRKIEDFGPSAADVAFGRYYNSGAGNYNFVAMDHNTKGYANADPKVWDVVINEIMYNPISLPGDTYDDEEYEYIELYNRTGATVDLQEYDPDEMEYVPWRFTNGIHYSFPPGASIPANGYIVVVKNLAAFSERYPTVPSGKIYGPFEEDMQLSNGGEKLDLSIPGDLVDTERMYIRIDRVDYSDGSHGENFPGGVDPWPSEPDGNNGDGSSLSRKVPGDYGNDVNNWEAAIASPAAINP